MGLNTKRKTETKTKNKNQEKRENKKTKITKKKKNAKLVRKNKHPKTENNELLVNFSSPVLLFSKIAINLKTNIYVVLIITIIYYIILYAYFI